MNEVFAKVVFLGASGVGKTCIVQRAIEDIFDDSKEPTVGASYSTIRISNSRNENISLRIWDTAGQERFKSLAPMYYHDSKVAIIVYSIDSRDSFVSAQDWISEIESHCRDEMPKIIIVGNKKDLPNRDITYDEGNNFASHVAGIFCETSALTGEGVNDLFSTVADLVSPKNDDIARIEVNTKAEKKKCC